MLIDSGEGLKVVTALLERLLAEKGAGAAKEAWAATGMSLLEFVPKASTPAHLDVLKLCTLLPVGCTATPQ